MENNSLFPFKYRLRKTDELVEVIAWETAERGARSENDWVSYIDASGVEHFKEHLTLEWDFKIENPLEKAFEFKPDLLKTPTFDPWESRRFELAKQMFFDDYADTPEDAVASADAFIAVLKPKGESAPGHVVYDPNKGL